MTIIATPGDENANSYITLAGAGDYFANRTNTSAWDAVGAAQEDALIQATLLLDQFDYVGIPVTSTADEDGYLDTTPLQALKWPRVLNDNGDLIRNYGGMAQVETATIVGTITGDGDATVTLTADGLTGSPITLNVAVLIGDDPAAVATKIRAALEANADIADSFSIGGTGADIVLTRTEAAANDSTLNLAYSNGTCTGLTPDASSTATIEGAEYAIPRPVQYAQCETALWLLQVSSDGGLTSGSERLGEVDLGPIKLKYESAGSQGDFTVDPYGLPIQAARFLKGLRLIGVLA